MAIGSSYMQRTQTAGNQKTWTVSMWVKRGDVDTQQCLMSVEDGAAYVLFKFNASEFFEWRGETGSARFITTRVFRDPAAWYHIVVACDTTESVEADRFKIYVNGVQETSFGTETYPAEDSDTYMNKSGGILRIGSDEVPGSYLNGCMSWVQLVDGLALAPTQFGSFDATSGIWKIKPGAYGTPGTNGFTLAMEDRSNLDLDTSSNAHTFTTTGTITATYDNPSNNFATFNPVDDYWAVITETHGNTTLTTLAGGYLAPGVSTLGMEGGKWYFEVKAASADNIIGIVSSQVIATGQYVGNLVNDWGYYGSNGNSYNNGSSTSYGDSYTTSDIIGVAVDLENSKLYFAKNNTWQNSGVPTSGGTGTGALSITAVNSTPLQQYQAAVTANTTSITTTSTNFGNGYFGVTAVTSAEADGAGIGAFEYAPPTGYYALCTKNIKAYGG